MISVVLPRLRGPDSTLGDRNFIDAVLYRLRTGIPWRDLPERFGKWKTIHTRFNRWAHKGYWDLIFKELQLDYDEEGVLIDASIVRAHQDAAGGKGGSSGMHWVVLEVGSPRRSTRSSTRGGGQSTSKSRRGSSTSPQSRKKSSKSTRGARRW
jgi:transposase